MTTKTTYTWRTDAASGKVTAIHLDAAVAGLVLMDEWCPLDSDMEKLDIENGAWLTIFDPDEVPVYRRGVMS